MRIQQLAGAILLSGLVVITVYVIDSDGSMTADSSSTSRVSGTCPGPTCTIEPVEPTANNCPNGSDCLNIDRPGATSIPEITRGNGVISITVLKDGFPMITNMAINGWEIVPHHHAGADFQFSTRWDDSCCGDGNLYNPTLGGDCEFGPNAPRGNPSCLMGIDQNWSGGCLPKAAGGYPGLLMHVLPRLYNHAALDDAQCSCMAPGDFACLIEMMLGITLGDGLPSQGGHVIPKEIMILDMSIIRKSGSPSPPILKRLLSEMPVAFPYQDRLPFAFVNSSGSLSGSGDWDELNRSVQPAGTLTPGVPTPTPGNDANDTRAWGHGEQVERQCVFGVALCTHDRQPLGTPGADSGPGSTCLAFYVPEGSNMVIGSRAQHGGLNMMQALGDSSCLGLGNLCSLATWYTKRVLVAVGDLSTISQAASQAIGAINSVGNGCIVWGNWSTPEPSLCSQCTPTASPLPPSSTPCPTWTPTATPTGCGTNDCVETATPAPCQECTPSPTPNYCTQPTATATRTATSTLSPTPKFSPTPTATDTPTPCAPVPCSPEYSGLP